MNQKNYRGAVGKIQRGIRDMIKKTAEIAAMEKADLQAELLAELSACEVTILTCLLDEFTASIDLVQDYYYFIHPPALVKRINSLGATLVKALHDLPLGPKTRDLIWDTLYFWSGCLVLPRNRTAKIVARNDRGFIIEDREWKYHWFVEQIGMGVYQLVKPIWDDPFRGHHFGFTSIEEMP